MPILYSFGLVLYYKHVGMKQEESWQKHYDEIMLFMEQNHRCPSRHRLEDHRMLNWIKYNKKQIVKGLLPADRLNVLINCLKLPENITG